MKEFLVRISFRPALEIKFRDIVIFRLLHKFKLYKSLIELIA